MESRPQAIGWFVGQVMRQTGGKANPARVNAILRAKLAPNLKSASEAPMQRPIEIFYWPTPNGHKVTIACEEMGLPYEIRPVNIGRGRAVHAASSSPSRPTTACRPSSIPTDRTASRSRIFESGAILQYLGRKTGLFYPADERGA